LLQITLARILGVDQYGNYTYVLAYAYLLAMPGNLGFRTAVVRLLPSYCIQNDFERARGLVQFSLSVSIAASILVAGTGIAVVYITQPVSAKALYLAMILIPFLALSDLHLGLLRGAKKMVLSLAPTQIARPAVLIVSVLIASYLLVEVSSTVAIILMFVSICLALMIQVAGFARVKSLWPETATVKMDAGKWFKIAIALFFADSFYEILNRIDIIMLGSMYDESASGIYNVAARTSAMVSIVISAVNAAAASNISEIYTTEGAGKSLQRLVSKIARWVFWFSLLISVLLAVFGKLVLSMFGNEFIAAYDVLLICIIGQVINSVAGSVGMLLNMTGNQAQVAKIYGFSAIVNVLLNYILIPEYGIYGAAYATIATTFIWNASMVYVASSRIGVNTTVLCRKTS